ncbi:hypothetical protein MPTK1_2g11490 [Marchantia polymorpha subsp. ruderalis]|uniref:Uncharacterized protein n=1 Tax=Marchantia polymorpha TaxID=3197 RepID=A0A2R6XCH9_MARPO|nr:hypothetical protein MARPO_0023s0115 [Marchantia polymorpha]BBN01946.1 hypothetical protein Mp_2g11490 [Marchantia polymorpha subsp. ruderalis]|eukprot:PTQ43808.1 hypothetical protein MARPO_0023s0115 [Marchantia polymorpha]
MSNAKSVLEESQSVLVPCPDKSVPSNGMSKNLLDRSRILSNKACFKVLFLSARPVSKNKQPEIAAFSVNRPSLHGSRFSSLLNFHSTWYKVSLALLD